ncbi:hypothetical protein O181_034047 [Austropuccinia psidii MF-1]|uniref:Uncharacterized protein n=1 Tax=Austropuccinia psidii MF-1 TaxID=1389203 RepID=A0A9Q3D2I3_9BASI|nr:hypothetical protein [Austropuccinia psidii MF-1]
MSHVHLRNLGVPRNQTEDREGLSRTRRPGRGHLGHSGECKDIDGNNTHYEMVQPSIPLVTTLSKFPEEISQRDRLQRPYGNHQRFEYHQEVQTPEGEGNQDKGESSHYPSYRRTADPDRAYSDSFRLTRIRMNQLFSGFKPFRYQQISDQESPLFTIPGGFQEKTRIQGQKQDLFQPKAGRVRLNDPEAVGLGERSTQEPEIVLNAARISIPNN